VVVTTTMAMKVIAYDTPEALDRLIGLKAYAPIRDRLRAVRWAMDRKTAGGIGQTLGCHHVTVRRWISRYNHHGIDGLRDQPRSGQPTKLARDKEAAFRARLLAGPTPADGVSVFHGRDIQTILAREFAAVYSLDSVYQLMKRLGWSPLRPRPRHPKRDEAAEQAWRVEAPLLSRG
jgi:transposase